MNWELFLLKRKKKQRRKTHSSLFFGLILSLAMTDVGKTQSRQGEERHTSCLDGGGGWAWMKHSKPQVQIQPTQQEKNPPIFSSISKWNIRGGRKKISIQKVQKVSKAFQAKWKQKTFNLGTEQNNSYNIILLFYCRSHILLKPLYCSLFILDSI